MTHARSLTYRHLIKLGDVSDAVQLLEKNRKKTVVENLHLSSSEQNRENTADTSSQSREQNIRNWTSDPTEDLWSHYDKWWLYLILCFCFQTV